MAIKNNNDESYDVSLSTTLYKIHRTIQAWGEQYSYCNADQVFGHIDGKINDLLREYLGFYVAVKDKSNPKIVRRLLGVQLLTDCSSKPILPLLDETEVIESILSNN